MLVPLSWLLEYAPLPPPVDYAEVGRRLTAIGLEIEAVGEVGHDISGVVVARVLEIEELAGHKLLALFDRAAAQDFADVYVLARRFGKDVLLARATQIDAGFDTRVLASMLATLDRFTDSEIPLPDDSSTDELRAFYATWRSELTA